MIQALEIGKTFQQRRVLSNISFTVPQGEFFGIIGPNGSGKSTLLSILSGLVAPDTGLATIHGRSVNGYKRKELARWMAVLQQDALPPNGFTVREVVAMGRYPFQNWFGQEAGDVSQQIESVMECLNLTALADRPMEQLSGGERQRTALAKAMVQEPNLLLLDEPTTYLDIGYQIQFLDLIRRWQQSSNLTVIAVLHDLNLASMYCDRLMLLHEGRIVRLGKPSDVITSPTIRSVYGAEATVIDHPGNGVPQILLGMDPMQTIRRRA
jgi:iron complex transport system ATP-binding protein